MYGVEHEVSSFSCFCWIVKTYLQIKLLPFQNDYTVEYPTGPCNKRQKVKKAQ